MVLEGNRERSIDLQQITIFEFAGSGRAELEIGNIDRHLLLHRFAVHSKITERFDVHLFFVFQNGGTAGDGLQFESRFREFLGFKKVVAHVLVSQRDAGVDGGEVYIEFSRERLLAQVERIIE